MARLDIVSPRPIKVFLSSTKGDLDPFRDAVRDILAKNPDRFRLERMEHEPAETASPKEGSLRQVRDCDVYVGVIGWRSGSIPHNETRSFVELEYLEAKAAKKEILLFLASEKLKPRHDDASDDAKRIAAFRAILQNDHRVESDHFQSPEQLASQVISALLRLESPRASIETTRQSYLRWVVRTHEELSLVGLKRGTSVPVKLQEVYVALRGDRIGAQELLQSQQLLEDQLKELERSYPELKETERRRLRASLLRESPHMMSLRERDRSARAGAGVFQSQASSITLANAFQRHRWLVILGDPGSGKTTLARWVALNLARSRQTAGSRVRVPAQHVNPETPYDRRLIDLGPARLPILVRVSEYAGELARCKQEGTALPLLDWLSRATWDRQPPSDGGRLAHEDLDRLFRSSLEHGDAVVILDGLDEITEKTARDDVVKAVRAFCRDAPFAGSPGSGTVPAEGGGNQLVVTSRIAGYHSAPLVMQGVTTVIIEPMRRVAVEHFCSTWMQAVYRELRGESDDGDPERAAQDIAARLIAAIFANPSLAEIATNPLLITNIASLYLSTDEALPRSRAELYQRLIQLLILDWRQTSLDLDEVLYVLAPIAAEIHEKYPTGLIESADFESLVKEHLACARGRQADAGMARDARRFVSCVSDQVGLIASRGERLFGFLHLTFQEYLTGCWLVSDPATAVPAILSKLGDPRWREPILLAIGYVGLKWPSAQSRRLLEELLAADDPLGDFLPRVALLLGEAITELPDLPETSFRRLVSRLLRSYAAESTRQFPPLAARIERTFLRLRRFGSAEVMDELLAAAIVSPDAPELAPAAAALVHRNGWLTPPIVQALRDGLERDSAGWNWPIESALADVASPPPSPFAPVVESVDEPVRQALERLKELETGELLARLTVEVPALEAETKEQVAELEELERRVVETAADEDADGRLRLKQLYEAAAASRLAMETLSDLQAGGTETRERLTRAVDNARAAIERLLFSKPRDYERLLSRYAIAVAAREDYDLRAGLRVQPEIAGTELPVRDFLEQARVPPSGRYDYRQLAALAAIYGGYPNRRTHETVAEYQQIATFLGRSDAEREVLLDAADHDYISRFGNGDIIYRMAKYLDDQMDGRLDLANEPAELTPAAMYRSSPIDRVVLYCLRRRLPAEEWIPRFWTAWREEPSLRGKADAIAALVALGEDVAPALRLALADSHSRAAAESAIRNLLRLKESLSDTVYRARTVLLDDLKTLDQSDPYRWIDIADTVLLTLARSTAAPIDFSPLVDVAPALYRPALQADHWCRTFAAGTDRPYYTAVILDTVPAAVTLVELLAHVNSAPSLRAGRLPFRWPVEPIPPKLVDDPGDIPPEVLEALEMLHLESIHPNFHYVISEIAVTRFQVRVARNPDLAAVLGAFKLRAGIEDSADEVLGQLASARDRYCIARTLADLLPFFSRAHREKLLPQCLSATASIKDPFRRGRVLEMLLPLVDGKERESILQLAGTAARKIADPGQKARSLARLARWQGNLSEIHWMDAIRSAAAIALPYEKSETLRTLAEHMPAQEKIAALWQQAFSTLRTDEARARAAGRRATLLLREPPASLREKLNGHGSAWAPVLLTAAVEETTAQLNRSEIARDLWVALARDPGNTATLHALLELEAEDGIPLTVEAAQAVNALSAARQTEAVRLLLPLLQSPTPDARRHIDRWLTDPDPFVVAHAALLIAENGRRINEVTFPHLLALLEESPDRSRCRAELVLRSQIWSVEKDEPCLKVSELGMELCDAIARAKEDFLDSDVHVSHVCHAVSADYIHDDELALEQWIARARARGDADPEACHNLKMVLRLTERTGPLFVTALIEEDLPVQLLLFESLVQMAYVKGRIPDEARPAFIEALRRLDPDDFEGVRVLIDPERTVAQVSVAVATNGTDEENVKNLVARAEEQLRHSTTTLAEILRTEDGDTLLNRLGAVGRTNFHYLDGSEPEAQAAAALIVEHESAFPLLLEWLTVRLSQDAQPSVWYDVTSSLLTVVGRAVRMLPAMYARHADASRLERLLTRTARSREHINGRRAAVLLLGHLNQIGKPAVEALLLALRDDRLVQDAAVEVIERLPLRADVHSSLVSALDSHSAGVARGAARMLSVIGSNERTRNDVRDEILQALVQRVGRSRWRGLHQLTGSGSNAADRVALTRLGSLDHEIYRAVLQVTGLAAPAH